MFAEALTFHSHSANAVPGLTIAAGEGAVTAREGKTQVAVPDEAMMMKGETQVFLTFLTNRSSAHPAADHDRRTSQKAGHFFRVSFRVS